VGDLHLLFFASFLAHSGLGQEPTFALQQTPLLFDDLIGGGEQIGRHGEAERLRGLEVDDQLELGGLLRRQVAGLFALEDATEKDARLAPLIGVDRPLAHPPAGIGPLAREINCRHRVARCQREDLRLSANHDHVVGNQECIEGRGCPTLAPRPLK
jgi:hypothetical protein